MDIELHVAGATITVPVSITMDTADFDAFITRLKKGIEVGATLGVDDAAKFAVTELRRALRKYPHPLDVDTPSPPFRGPVGMLTTGSGGRWPRVPGLLRDSVRARLSPFTHSARVFVTAPYARIQEFGGMTGGKRTGGVHHQEEATGMLGGKAVPSEIMALFHHPGGHTTFLPPRPYFLPTMMRISTTDVFGLEHLYYDNWMRAIEASIAM